ncbi:MAG: vWA domain-containing protein [Candidatus Kariarchaeaceae archaeon]|jgi:predicted metal-dependent peptidase
MFEKDPTRSIKQFFDISSSFEKDNSPEGEYEAVRLSRTRSSLFLDMPFFGYILGHLEIFPVNDARIPSYAADTRRIYINPKYTEAKTIEQLKGMMMHLVTHLIMKHGERMQYRNKDIWNISTDVTTRIIVNEAFELQTHDTMKQFNTSPIKSKSWEVDSTDEIPDTLRDTSADDVYRTLFNYAESLVGIDSEGDDVTSKNIHTKVDTRFSDEILEEVIDYSGIENPCSFTMAMDELYVGLDTDLAKLDGSRFDGIIRTGWLQGKGKGQGRIPGALKEIINQLINPKLPWHTLLMQHIQHTIMSDWKWVPANRRMISMDIHLPSTIKEHMDIIVAVDTSGSISTNELTSFVSETHAIVSSFSSVKMTLIDCDMKIQQVMVIEDGQSIDGRPLPWEGRDFKGRGGTSFIPVFEWVDDDGNRPDVLVYFTDGYGTFPTTTIEYPVLWVMTTDVDPPLGDVIRYESSDDVV